MKTKKVLILAYDFPPYNSIGAQRPYSWLKYFNEFGFQPIIVTRHWDEIRDEEDYYKASKKQFFEETEFEGSRVIRAPFKPNFRDKLILKKGRMFILLRKLLSLIYNIGQYYHFSFDNRSSLYKAAESIIKKEKIDLIIVSVEPYVLFRYGYLLNKKYKLPWIADYRDEWTTDSIHLPNKALQFQFKLFMKRREQKFLKSSSLIISAAKNYSDRIEALLNQKVHTIYNGFFENDFSDIIPEIPNDNFEIAYIGSLYDYQPLEEFLDGVELFINEQNPENFKIKFYGTNFMEVERRRILSYKPFLNSYIETTDRIPRIKLYSILAKKASALLVLASPTEVRIPGKIFDYIGLRKKIILFKDDKNVLSDIISDSKTGLIINSSEEVKNILIKMYTSRQNLIQDKISEDALKFTRKNQTKELTELLKEI